MSVIPRPALGGSLAGEASFSKEVETDDQDENDSLRGHVLHSGIDPQEVNGRESRNRCQGHDISFLEFPDARACERDGHEGHQDRGHREEGRSGIRTAANCMSK